MACQWENYALVFYLKAGYLGIYCAYAGLTVRFSMRAMWSRMGSAGEGGGTKGLSEVQESLLGSPQKTEKDGAQVMTALHRSRFYRPASLVFVWGRSYGLSLTRQPEIAPIYLQDKCHANECYSGLVNPPSRTLPSDWFPTINSGGISSTSRRCPRRNMRCFRPRWRRIRIF